MQEILPGLFHFTQVHENLGFEVNSYYLYEERVLIDPMVPAEGLDWFTEQEKGPPTDILLSCRHHYRHSSDYGEAFGTNIHCVREGMHEFKDKDLPVPVVPFEFGDELPGGVTAERVTELWPDETAFLLPKWNALLIADGAVAPDPTSALMFVPDQHMDDPPKTKRALTEGFRRLLDLDFENVLLAHGGPMLRDGRTKLEAFVEAGPAAASAPMD